LTGATITNSTNGIFLQPASDDSVVIAGTNTYIRFINPGTAASPSFNYNGTHGAGTGLFYVDANPSLDVSINGVSSYQFWAGVLLPSTAGDINLGSTPLPWENIYSVNELTVTSDARLKKDVTDLNTFLQQDYLSIVNTLKPVAFQFINAKTPAQHFGFIAQDVMKTVSAAQAKSNVPFHIAREENGKCVMANTQLIPLLAGAINQMSLAISNLQDRLGFVEAKQQK
jgi:hypothetical protein